MSTLSELLESVKQGQPGSQDVLLDHLLEQGLEREDAITLINSYSMGQVQWDVANPTRDPRAFRPAVLYDTVVVRNVEGYVGEFWRDLQDKPESDCNIYSPRRLPAGDEFQIRRVTLTGPSVQGAVIKARINRMPYFLDCPVESVMARGVWGMPVMQNIRDNDDIQTKVIVESVLDNLLRETSLRLTFYGWCRSPMP